MTIVFFGNYDPEYSRNRVLIRGLRARGITVLECNDRTPGIRKFFKLRNKFAALEAQADAVLVAFPSQFMTLFARRLTRKPIITDAFTSHYEGYIEDRKLYRPGSLRARWYAYLDRRACSVANAVLFDTIQHQDYFVSRYGVAEKKCMVVPVSTDTSSMRSYEKTHDGFLVHFHGHYIPLQGVQYIVEAAQLLSDLPITFRFVGVGSSRRNIEQYVQSHALKNVVFMDEVSYETLPKLMSEADVCLGIFGDTEKTMRVVPNKVFEALACERAVLTGDTPAIRSLLTDQTHIALCAVADARAIARALRALYEHDTLRTTIARRGHEYFLEHLTEEKVVAPIVDYVNQRIALRS